MKRLVWMTALVLGLGSFASAKDTYRVTFSDFSRLTKQQKREYIQLVRDFMSEAQASDPGLAQNLLDFLMGELTAQAGIQVVSVEIKNSQELEKLVNDLSKRPSRETCRADGSSLKIITCAQIKDGRMRNVVYNLSSLSQSQRQQVQDAVDRKITTVHKNPTKLAKTQDRLPAEDAIPRPPSVSEAPAPTKSEKSWGDVAKEAQRKMSEAPPVSNTKPASETAAPAFPTLAQDSKEEKGFKAAHLERERLKQHADAPSTGPAIEGTTPGQTGGGSEKADEPSITPRCVYGGYLIELQRGDIQRGSQSWKKSCQPVSDLKNDKGIDKDAMLKNVFGGDASKGSCPVVSENDGKKKSVLCNPLLYGVRASGAVVCVARGKNASKECDSQAKKLVKDPKVQALWEKISEDQADNIRKTIHAVYRHCNEVEKKSHMQGSYKNSTQDFINSCKLLARRAQIIQGEDVGGIK